MDATNEIRRFSRFYTRQIGLLNEHLPASDLSLAEGRVLYELATSGKQTSADLCRKLNMDKAHVSRVLARFKARGYVQSRPKPENAKHLLLSLRPPGNQAFKRLDHGTNRQMQSMLAPLSAPAQLRLVSALRDVAAILGDSPEVDPVKLRRLKVGDLSYVAYRQGVLYHQEYGWNAAYESLVLEILANFAKTFDAKREDGWVAEQRGLVVGSIFLMRSADAHVAKLRLLYVEPSARGSGIGRMLVQKCIARARQLSYKKLVLWTNDVLVAARRIYLAEGFQLVEESSHHSFGKKLKGQTWSLDLL